MNHAAVKAFMSGPHQTALEQLFPGKVVYLGRTYACTGSEESFHVELEAGGIKQRRQANIDIRKCLLPTKPQPETIITYKETNWRIKTVDGMDSMDPVWRLECTEEFR